jgi:EmrB/QacA subfamily drug resistance transporter
MKLPAALPLLVASTLFMEQLDGTILVTALPNIASSFGGTAAGLDLSVSAYLVTLSFMIPASGWIADRLGTKRVYGSAIAVFVLASILCGASQTVWQFVGARILQGFGGAMMVPVGRLIVLRETEKKDLIRSIAYLTWPALSAPLLGPPLGGFITTYASWHWIFYINVPLGFVALPFVWKIVPGGQVREPRKFDAAGFFLTGAAILSLLFSIEFLGRTVVPIVAAIVLFSFGLACGAAAIRRGLNTREPLISLVAFRTVTFRLAMRGGGVFRGCLAALPFLLPLLFQVGFGLDPVTSGTLLLALFAGNLGMKPATSWILRHVRFRRTMLVSGCVAIATMLGCAMLTGQTPHVLIIALLVISGLARSMQFTTISTLAFSDVPKPAMGSANTLFSIQQQAANACGVAVAGALLRLISLSHGGGGVQMVEDFQFTFLIVAIFAAFSMIDFYRVPLNAGEALH